jgi:hypothetical protein
MVRALFLLIFVAALILDIASLFILPSQVAIHFTFGGRADNWAPGYAHTLIFLGIHVVLFISFYLVPRQVFKFPPRMINLPNKEFWFLDANKPRAEATFQQLMWQFGAAVFLFLLAVEVLVIRANLSAPVRLNEKVFIAALAAFLLYTPCWCIALFRAFRVMPETKSAEKR